MGFIPGNEAPQLPGTGMVQLTHTREGRERYPRTICKTVESNSLAERQRCSGLAYTQTVYAERAIATASLFSSSLHDISILFVDTVYL